MSQQTAPTTSDHLHIAVIGAGPAGVYSADILLRQLKTLGEQRGIGSKARVDIFEQLPVPFGLVRYGVAPDHPSIKFIADALERTLNNPDIHLYCDVTFGKDVTLDDLLERYDAIMFATGAIADAPLRIPGADAHGVFGAAQFVAWYDGHPMAPTTWDLSAERVAVIGGGNVAMDVARELMRDADYLKAHTDIPDNVYEGIARNQARELHLFIRRGIAQAKFSVQELRELEKLDGVEIIVDPHDFELDEETIAFAEQDKITRQMVEELCTIADLSADMQDAGGVDYQGQPATKRYCIHFNSAPVEVVADDNNQACGIRVERTITGADGVMHSAGEFEEYAVDAVYHAIGYECERVEGIAYDDSRLALANLDGRITNAINGEVLPRLYATGWANRGPIGLIGSTKSDALAIVSRMIDDFASSPELGRFASDRADNSINELLADRGITPIDFAGWKRVDAFERSAGELEGRDRKKVVALEELRRIATGQ